MHTLADGTIVMEPTAERKGRHVDWPKLYPRQANPSDTPEKMIRDALDMFMWDYLRAPLPDDVLVLGHGAFQRLLGTPALVMDRQVDTRDMKAWMLGVLPIRVQLIECSSEGGSCEIMSPTSDHYHAFRERQRQSEDWRRSLMIGDLEYSHSKR
jgi:hypothetical protein